MLNAKLQGLIAHAGRCATGSRRAAAGMVGVVAVCFFAGCAMPPHTPADPMPRDPASQPTVAIDDPVAWAAISKIIGKPGVYANQVYTITIPRDDLTVTAAIGDVPIAAGIETTLYFYKCPCGRMSATGRFVVADYEANDVIAELQQGGFINIASLSPMLLREKPHLLVVQYQGDGEAGQLATVIRHALNYTAEARLAPVKAQD